MLHDNFKYKYLILVFGYLWSYESADRIDKISNSGIARYLLT